MSSYATIASARTGLLDQVALLAAVKSATGDATAVVISNGDGTWRGKKAAPWSAGDISAAQNAIDTVAELTPPLAAQRAIDRFPIEYQALVLALIDAINTLRALHSLAAVTPAQAITSIRNKAGTL